MAENDTRRVAPAAADGGDADVPLREGRLSRAWHVRGDATQPPFVAQARGVYEDIARNNPYSTLGQEAGVRAAELNMRLPAATTVSTPAAPTAPAPAASGAPTSFQLSTTNLLPQPLAH